MTKHYLLRVFIVDVKSGDFDSRYPRREEVSKWVKNKCLPRQEDRELLSYYSQPSTGSSSTILCWNFLLSPPFSRREIKIF